MMSNIDKALIVAKKLIPPPEGASERHMYRWRAWMAGSVLCTALTLLIHIALACGLTPFYPGFAQAKDLVVISEQMKAQRIGSLEANILDARQKQCAAAPGVRALYTSSLQKLLIEYYTLTARNYPLPDCDSF